MRVRVLTERFYRTARTAPEPSQTHTCSLFGTFRKGNEGIRCIEYYWNPGDTLNDL